MKTNSFFKAFLVVAALLINFSMLSARGLDGNLIHNKEEVDGLMVGQTIYKKDGNTLTNYMKYGYKYDDQKRMTESETQKWNSSTNQWVNDLRMVYKYSGKTITTNYYKWNSKKGEYILAPEMTVTMDSEI